MIKKLLLLPVLVCLLGCATPPDKISARYTSTALYQGLSCSQLSDEALRIQIRAKEITRSAQNDANWDTAKIIFGLTPWTWPTLMFIDGDGLTAAEYAQLKGETIAVIEVAKTKQCDFAKNLPDPPPPQGFAPPTEKKMRKK